MKYFISNYDNLCVSKATLSDGSEVYDVLWDGLKLHCDSEQAAHTIAQHLDHLIQIGFLVAYSVE